ncbi:MAG: PulJ/GspJ family protein [Candidatus Microsaccharimonas sp.]
MRRFTDTLKASVSRGFTLVEMMVVAPIVILLIGAFIALLVNLTGEVMSSRGANVLAFDVQSALNRIEQDVKLSTTFIGETNIDLATTKQGFGTSTTAGSTVKFTNNGTGGSPASIILNALVTTTNPVSSTSQLVYTPNTPNNCNNALEYSKNTPMTMNIVYFIQNNSLWRRVIMPADYASAGARCGTTPPWQIPTCINGYAPASLPFCKANDERILDDITQAGFVFNYYRSADTASPDATAKGSGSVATRNTALQSDTTIEVSLTSAKAIAGRDISKTSTLRVTRLDTNASAIYEAPPPSAAPSVPVVSGTVSDGHNVTFTWPRIDTATSYSIDYRINSGAWVTGETGLDNNSRSYTVTEGGHEDTVYARVRAHNVAGASGYGNETTPIPLWAPLTLNGGWTDYSLDYGAAAYTKTKSGYVLFRGLVKNATTPAAGTIMASLPSDYNPSQRLIFGSAASANVSARMDVSPSDDGAQLVFSTNGSGGWMSLDNIRYLAGDSGSRTALTLQNGWGNYGGSYGTPTYAIDSVGRVSIQGLISGGTTTTGTTIAALPAAATPPLNHIMASYSNSAFGAFGANSSPSTLITRSAVSAGWLSINTSYMPNAAGATWSNLALGNSWANYGSPYGSAQYTKTSDGIVHLKGLIRNGTNTYDTTIATLPAGFRPKYRLLFTVVQNSDSFSRLDVLPNGQVRYMGSNNGYYSLSNISFPAEQ